MRLYLGKGRRQQVRDAVGTFDPGLLDRFNVAVDVGWGQVFGPFEARSVDLWIDDWWMIARMLAGTHRSFGTVPQRREMRRYGRLIIGRLSQYAGHAAYRGYAAIGDKDEVYEGWRTGQARYWAGVHQFEGPGEPVFLVPQLHMWNGRHITRWHPRVAVDELWRADQAGKSMENSSAK